MRKKILLLVCICFYSIGANAQTIFEALNGTKIYNYPYDITHTIKGPKYEITSLADKIPIAKSWMDLDGTIPDLADNIGAYVSLIARFNNRDGKYFFQVISHYTDRSISEYLILMNTDGTISDYLWVGLFFPTIKTVYPMDFRIDATGNIIVYQINSYPTKGVINPYDRSITSFQGQRTDKKYQISNGKFVLKSTTKYKPITYKMSDLSNKERRIYNGTETPQ